QTCALPISAAPRQVAAPRSPHPAAAQQDNPCPRPPITWSRPLACAQNDSMTTIQNTPADPVDTAGAPGLAILDADVDPAQLAAEIRRASCSARPHAAEVGGAHCQ